MKPVGGKGKKKINDTRLSNFINFLKIIVVPGFFIFFPLVEVVF